VLNLIAGLWPVVLRRYNRLRLYRAPQTLVVNRCAESITSYYAEQEQAEIARAAKEQSASMSSSRLAPSETVSSWKQDTSWLRFVMFRFRLLFEPFFF
jgi:hypothetical protein